MALGHLVVRYGRRLAKGGEIGLLHINHGWRGAESDADEAHVRERAQAWGVPLTVHRLEPVQDGCSLEDQARRARKKIYAKHKGLILTAHHADDLAETLLWRLFTGAGETHAGGILARHGNELRPLLTTRKQELQAYLQEEGETWREDRTNHEGRFLRSRMRQELMPAVERLFPRAVEHLMRLALQAQKHGHLEESPPLETLLGARLKRVHVEALNSSSSRNRIDLPGGWSLTRDRSLQVTETARKK
jgi:tRNA(Ile)-lysidine synthase